ncbi:MAG: class I SAM-dependent methyltransferase [Candidatus Bathyarchaeota archaeon]|nr:class I SAM-dependent methyltransferase [Candidatus Bathyarchaeota archaeon]
MSAVPAYKVIFHKHRAKIFASFINSFSIHETDICLDIGGVSKGFEPLSSYCECININLHTNQKSDQWENVIADARFLPFKNKSVDYVISNSVIEHIEGGAERFSKELRRVAKNGYFISCPHYYTFVEPHYFMPFFQFVPEQAKKFLILKLGLKIGHMNKNNYEVIMLPKPAYLKTIFPNATLRFLNLFCLPFDVIILENKL